jgi:hypothetical protein
MLPGSRSCRNLSCSGIPSWPVGILTPTESHLRPSRLPHSCSTREVAVAPCRRARHRMPARVSLSAAGGSCAGWAVRRPADIASPASIGCVTAEPLPSTPVPDTSPFEVIHLGGEAAVVVPVADFLRLQALQRHTSAEELEEAEIEATLAAHQAWVAAGRPGAVSHEEAMAELLGGRA